MSTKEVGAPVRIDAHQHFWRYDPEEYAFIDQRMPILKRDYLPVDLEKLLVDAGLSGCVAVQARQTLAETRWLLELADANEFVRAVVGWVDLRAADLEAVLVELSAHPRLRGVRHIVQAEPSVFLEDAAFIQGVSKLPRYGLAYDMLVYESQLSQARKFMAALPDVSFVLDHVGKPNLRSPDFSAFVQRLRPVAELPNVVCKLSGLVTEADWGTWTPKALRPYLDASVELFGTERLLFGSDFPVCLLAARYSDAFGLIDDYFAAFSASERARIFGENAARVYRIDA